MFNHFKPVPKKAQPDPRLTNLQKRIKYGYYFGPDYKVSEPEVVAEEEPEPIQVATVPETIAAVPETPCPKPTIITEFTPEAIVQTLPLVVKTTTKDDEVRSVYSTISRRQFGVRPVYRNYPQGILHGRFSHPSFAAYPLCRGRPVCF